MKNSILAIAFFLSGNLISQHVLSPELLWQLGRVSEPRVSPDGKQVLYGVSYYNIAENKGNRDLYTISAEGGTPKQLTHTPGSESNALWRPDGKKIGYLFMQQLWEMNPDGSGAVKITNVEGGINGFMYSPDMKHIVFIKEVKTGQSTADIHPDLPKANVLMYEGLMMRHWDTWNDASYSHIFYAGYSDGKVGEAKDIMPGESYDAPMAPFGGMEQIAIGPDGKTIAYSCKKQKGTEYALSTNSEIYLCDMASGKTSNLTEGMKGYDTHPVFSNDGKKIAWLSMERDGYESDKERLFVYDFNTKKKEYLTEKLDQDATEIVWSADDKFIHFISGLRATYQVYGVELATKKISAHTMGMHNYSDLSKAGNHFIASKVSMSYPAEIVKIDGKTFKETPLTQTNKGIYDKIKTGRVEERNITTTDGKKMLVWVIYPPDFDPKKKYPALLYCQGGPHGAISQQFSYRWNFQLMAANGYIVVAPNRRGLPTFGQEWNDQISGDWGGQNMKDYLTAIDSVSAQPFVDKNRLGAVGASYGGYSVYYLAGNHNKRFKTFIAHAGVFNLESMYGTTEEIFFTNKDIGGPYWDKKNEKIYREFSPHRYVDKWDTPILITHGEMDLRVPISEGMQAFTAAQLKGIPSKFVAFPRENHWILSPQNALVWQREYFGWLDKWLKPEEITKPAPGF